MSFITRFRRLPARATTTAEGDPTTDDRLAQVPDDDAARDPAGDRRGARRVVARLTTALACLLVFLVLVIPSQVSHLMPAAFVRIPLDGLIAVAVVLVLPRRARRVAALLAGVALGLLAVVKIVSIGFSGVLDRQFDPVLDWPFLESAVVYLRMSSGRGVAIGAVVAAAVLAVAVFVLMVLSFLRLTRLAIAHRTTSSRTVAVLAVAWITCVVTGLQIVPDVPIAGRDYYDGLRQVSAGLKDQDAFAAEAAVDAFRDTPGEQLLTGLRGKDVVLAVVESYGRVAVEDPVLAPQIGALLDAGDRRLRAAGFAARSAFVTSPTTGGGSWLADSTLVSGLWIDNQQRYRQLVASDRLTLNGAFRRANWRTVAVMPGTTAAWPEGKFFGFDRIYAAQDLGYRGPQFSFATMPDQFTLATFERFEHGIKDHVPVMAEIVLISSHAPWEPVPQLLDWNDVGDGSVYDASSGDGAGADVVVRRDRTRLLSDYRNAIAYSLNSLISYVEKYGDDDLVLVFLGDHQPSPAVTGTGASRDVPITIVAHDQKVLDRISGWGWQDGLKPGPDAPVWRMDAFRDRFLTAFGQQNQPTASAVPTPR